MPSAQDAESSESKGVELEMCDTFSPSGDQPSGNCYASITVDGQAFSLIPDGSSSSPPSETVTECGDSGGGTSPPPTTGTTATNTGSCFPEGFYTNQKSWLGLDGVECESEQLDADKALAGSQKWLDSLGVGSVCQWKVDDWAAACDCVKTEKAAVDAGGTVCQECTKTLYESTLTQECRKALTEVQCTNFTPEQIATLQSQLGADKAAEVAARAKFGVGM
ncbi:hypothetical protein COHA_009013 [Chlorella ohadii]|uniref:Uncharacterized protein n=1 Tax=Chlorella ohadii TaxID=2649997 RepID=A0AAD5DKC6_9CHLO|nr:hypothetical protein COHA_009013 [Chlorella ohadii]